MDIHISKKKYILSFESAMNYSILLKKEGKRKVPTRNRNSCLKINTWQEMSRCREVASQLKGKINRGSDIANACDIEQVHGTALSGSFLEV